MMRNKLSTGQKLYIRSYSERHNSVDLLVCDVDDM